LEETGRWTGHRKRWVWKDEGRRDERQIGVGMTGRILRSYRRIKSVVKAAVVQNGVPMNTKLLVQVGGRKRRIRKLYLKTLGKRDFEDMRKSCILRHAKRCCRLSSLVPVFCPRVEDDEDPREFLRGVDIGKR
jgi:hypothetical protein